MRKLIFTLAICLLGSSANCQLLPSFGASRSGTTGMQFLKIGVDARSCGMAGAVVSTTDDINSMYWNPAGITRIDSSKFDFSFGHTRYFAQTSFSNGAAVKRYKHAYWGVSMFSFNSGQMPVTTEFQPLGTGQTFSVNNTVIGLTYAKALTNQFSFGITGKYARENIAGIVNQNGVIDFGFQYNVGWQNTRFAVVISNFGINTVPSGLYSHTTLKGNVNQTTFEQVSVPAVFRFGVSWDPIKTESQQLTVAAQLNHPTDNKETFALGAEYNWNQLLYGRMGYEFGQTEGIVPAFGVGIRAKRNFGFMRFDYGFNMKSRLGAVHRLSLIFSIF